MNEKNKNTEQQKLTVSDVAFIATTVGVVIMSALKGSEIGKNLSGDLGDSLGFQGNSKKACELIGLAVGGGLGYAASHITTIKGLDAYFSEKKDNHQTTIENQRKIESTTSLTR